LTALAFGVIHALHAAAEDGDCTSVAIFTPGGRNNRCHRRDPLTFDGVSRRFAGVPISLKSGGR